MEPIKRLPGPQHVFLRTYVIGGRTNVPWHNIHTYDALVAQGYLTMGGDLTAKAREYIGRCEKKDREDLHDSA